MRLQPESTPSQVRRRRQERLRCAPLADGRRDPLEPLPGAGSTSVRELQAWARALAHLRDAGLVGLAPAHIRRSLDAFPERYGHVA
jgi:hypothetical protein